MKDKIMIKNKIKVVKLNKEQYEIIKQHIKISKYGEEATCFESIEKILTAKKW